ncbi:MAG TPA: N-acetyltransferase [Dehalococcoidia bacterium]|nr:N-acetyltransferase [Dehalococcoidia bacterium]
MEADVIIEKATIADVHDMHRLINFFAERGDMLHRTLGELYENLRDFYVARSDEQVVGCGALHVVWSDLAELKSLAVDEAWQKQGLGSRLVQSCLNEATHIGLASVFCLTYRPDFFARHGFDRLDVMELPRKVWGECIRCPHFPHCNEIAMIRRFQPHIAPVDLRNLR